LQNLQANQAFTLANNSHFVFKYGRFTAAMRGKATSHYFTKQVHAEVIVYFNIRNYSALIGLWWSLYYIADGDAFVPPLFGLDLQSISGRLIRQQHHSNQVELAIVTHGTKDKLTYKSDATSLNVSRRPNLCKVF
jgi:hypothetical protein